MMFLPLPVCRSCVKASLTVDWRKDKAVTRRYPAALLFKGRLFKGKSNAPEPVFLPLLKETPKEAQIASHRLMLRAGMIQQSSAGIYSWLPLGKKVLDKIEDIVREE